MRASNASTAFMIGALVLAPVFGPPAAHAAEALPMTGASLEAGIKTCQAAGVTTKDIANYRACNGYIAGILVGFSSYASVIGAPQPFCIYDGIEDAVIQGAILDYIDNHPVARGENAPAIVIAAMATSFPCPNTDKRSNDPETTGADAPADQ